MNILSPPFPSADHRIAYGPGPCHFGDLWLPSLRGSQRAPVIAFYHGGWWKSEYDLGYAGHLCAAFRKEGFACWSIEYRRVGQTGGGWPATFHDAAAGFDHLVELAGTYPLDLSRVLTMGHSAGGHLAFWIAGRHHIDPRSELYGKPSAVPLRGAISLAGAVDLRLTIALAGDDLFAHDRYEVFNLMGGRPEDFPERYKAANPGDLLPFNIPQVLLQGEADDQIPPELPAQWSALARQRGNPVVCRMVPSIDHLQLVDPGAAAWPIIREAARKLVT